MLALLRERNFFLLWTAHTASILGDYVFFIAITYWVYAQTGSATATGAVLIASTIPIPLFAPLAGVVVDRWDRRRIMLAAESARAVLFLGLLVVVNMQFQELWPIYVVGFVQSALAAFFWPARSALLPQLLQPPSLLAANAWYLVSDSGARIIAPSLSALTLLHLGPAGVILLDAASFVLSAGCISLLMLPALPLRGTGSVPIRKPVAGRFAISGVSGLFVLGALLASTSGMLSIVLPVFVRTTLSAGPLAYGWMLTAQAVGEGTMSVLLGRVSPRLRQAKMPGFVAGCLALGGLALVLMASLHTLVPGLLLNGFFGAMLAATSIYLLTLLQRRPAARFLGRTLAIYAAAQSLAQVGGQGLASLLVARVGVLWLLVLSGALCFLGSGFGWVLVMRGDNRSGSDGPMNHQTG